MTLAIDLPPEVEERLRQRAARQGQDAATVAAAVLAEALEWETEEIMDATEGIQRGLEDFAAGRYRGFNEFAEEQRRKHSQP